MKGDMKLKLFFLTFIIACGSAFAQGNSKFRVVLDPGHGAKDYGANYHGFVEKNIVLNVALKVGKILEKESDVQVVYTRKTDVFIELDERCNIANRADANLFVSIHCNGEVKKTAFGTETFVMGSTKSASNLEVAKKENKVIDLENNKQRYAGFDPNKPETLIGLSIQQEAYINQSIEMASMVQDNFTNDQKRKSRGVKQAPFWVLHRTSMPSILIELGFISYQPEGEFLNSDKGQDDMAESIAKSILAYKKEYFVPGTQDYKEPVVPADTKPVGKVADAKPAVKPSEIKAIENRAAEAKASETKAAATSTKGVIFKVQISASGKTLELVPSNFKGLSPISKEASGTIIKYYYGETNEYSEAKELLEKAKEKGFSSAFVVAFKDGKKISVQEALK
jgi:N-acetylmuramoyl-L-alanine amidase